MVKRHLVVVKTPEGVAQTFPMKEWLRLHPALLPPGVDPTHTTSHELRRMLRKKGWEMEEHPSQVLLIQPDEGGDVSFADTLLESEPDSDFAAEEAAQEITFSLERDLQAALRRNLSQLEEGLSVTDGGAERVTEAGRIDITASDKSGNTVVVELKAGSAQPAIVAQVLAYMSSVAQEDAKTVRGIIVAGGFHNRVILASRAIPNLSLREYSFQFTFRPVD